MRLCLAGNGSTDLTAVNLNLAAFGGTSGGVRAAAVVLNGTRGDDLFLATGDASGTMALAL